uniref:Cell migration inducing hyaluronidase 1 n=1 Tax=Scleropages formosus TaxID=113540 RepID=A0A8C9TLN6_SCLFO
NQYICLNHRCALRAYVFCLICVFLCGLSVCVYLLAMFCPDEEPDLQPWTPGHNKTHRITIGYSQKLALTSSATVHSIEILNGGKLVIADTTQPIVLRTKYILIGDQGELHVGSQDCPYRGHFTIVLYGRSDDQDVEHTYFGRKYIGVGTGGTLEMHGEKKRSWTFLNKTLHPGEANLESYHFERGWGNRGIIAHVVDPETGRVLHSDRFDTYRSKNESKRLAQYVDSVEEGLILAMVVNDEGSNNLEDSAKKALVKLGSQQLHRLGFRWASFFVGPRFPATPPGASGCIHYVYVCLEIKYTLGVCKVMMLLLCVSPVRPHASITIDTHSNTSILELADDSSSWKPRDMVVVASTDYSMHQAEEFLILPCPTCSSNQVKVQAYLHMGEEVDGVDMRAEVGLLTRNILIQGEMEPRCYGSEACEFFHFDTFGGHIKAFHMQGVELMHMGQQSMGHYPVHFHMNGDVDERGGYDPPTYVKDLSIHHTFSRCVTIHGSNGLLVKDVVGYDALGHCFFTEDGPEERNTFEHCLGLLVKASTLLPSDRDSHMCRHITDGAYPGYVANPRQDCSATSTFWMANPNNNLINCAAAGSEETGFWFIFHHVPTGPSEGMYPPGRTEHTPMGQFVNNRAHSNYRAGMILDNGVKTTEASAKDKRPFLSLIGARYGPHLDADPFKPRVPARIHHFVAYKNQDHGAWLRGGDVCGGTFPDDDGSKQEVKNSLFVGESENRGTPVPETRLRGPGGPDLNERTMPRGVDFPIRGMQIYDGPINVQNCTFRKYVALEGRHTSAFGFRLNNTWQSCPNNNVTDITFDDVPIASRVFFGEPGPWFNKMQMDGDKTTIFHDIDGSVSEYPGAFLVKEDNWLLRHPDCIGVPDWRAAICSGHYAQIYIQTRDPANLNMIMVKDEYPDRPLVLEGALGKKNHYQQFQPVVTLAKSYTVHWDQTAPAEVTVWLINFNRNDWITVGFCYPKETNFTIISDIHNRLTKQTHKTGIFLRTFQREKMEHSHLSRGYYFWEEDTGLLFLKLKAYKDREDFAFCSVKGCERIKIKALIPKGSEKSDCRVAAYPRHSQMPVVDIPMPQKLPASKLVQVVNRTMIPYACSHFSEMPNVIAYWFKSIVMMTSKGHLFSRGRWTKVIAELGAEKDFRLKGSAFTEIHVEKVHYCV